MAQVERGGGAGRLFSDTEVGEDVAEDVVIANGFAGNFANGVDSGTEKY